MGIQNKIAFIFMFGVSGFAFAGDPPSGVNHDPRQFRFGFEPTRTNPRILLESGGAVVKKIVTGKGEGVLAAELPIVSKYRDKFMADIKKNCPECKIFEARESHGEVTFHIEFPDEYYIRSSLDAGALEWQTKPSTVPEIRKQVPVLQKEVFDRAKTIGVGYSIEATGGHTTFSGFGDEKVHQEHDAKWKKFLTEMETALDKKAPYKELVRIYENRDLMRQQEYSSKLLEIYYNPKLENERLGKRSKPKYVANKPYGSLIENRAIRPQKSADDLLKMAEFIEAEAWYVKDRMNEGLEGRFNPNSYVEESKNKVSRQTRKMVEALDLDWNRYKDLSPAGDVSLKGDEKNLIDDFSQKNYGAKKRDAVFRRLRDHFLAKQTLNSNETVFLADLLNEMSYTVPESIENAKHFKQNISLEKLGKLNPEQTDRLIKSAISFGEKFPAAKTEILEPVQDYMRLYVHRSLKDEGLTLARDVVPSLDASGKKEILEKMEFLHGKKPAFSKFGLYSDLVLDAGADRGNVKNYLETVANKYSKKMPGSLPARFDEVVALAAKDEKLKPHIRDATNAVIDWALDPKNARMKISDADANLLKWLADQKPSRSKEILAPLRSHYWEQLNANRFGEKNFYKTLADFDRLNEITPSHGKQEFLETMLAKVREMHKIKSDPDSAAFVERIEGQLKEINKSKASSCAGRLMSSLKGLFRR